jgi:hypothetical protein
MNKSETTRDRRKRSKKTIKGGFELSIEVIFFAVGGVLVAAKTDFCASFENGAMYRRNVSTECVQQT